VGVDPLWVCDWLLRCFLMDAYWRVSASGLSVLSSMGDWGVGLGGTGNRVGCIVFRCAGVEWDCWLLSAC
jgi:hypothetical protein